MCYLIFKISISGAQRQAAPVICLSTVILMCKFTPFETLLAALNYEAEQGS